MNVTINFGETGRLEFDMNAVQIGEMIKFAFGTTVGNAVAITAQAEEVKAESPIDYYSPEFVDRLEQNVAPMHCQSPKQSRTDRMFGTDWREKNTSNPEWNRDENGYKGFLLLECPQCGKRKAFCTKTPIKSSCCSCGYEIELKGLKVARLDCKCGKSWKYRTNITAQNFTHNCLSCNSPIDIIYNPRHGNFDTLR